MEDQFRQSLRAAPDELIRRPLWTFKPHQATAVIAERTARGFNSDPEPIGDPEYH